MDRKWLPPALVLILVTVVGWMTRDFGLVYDSRALLTRHPVVTGAAPASQAFHRPYLDQLGDERGLDAYYRPLPLLSFACGRVLWGLSPRMERGINLGLFAVWLILVFALVHRRENDRLLAMLVMLLCALFPLNWDNVSWVAGRPDLLMLVFGTAALLMLEGESGRGFSERAGSVFFFGLALFSKETAFFFLPLLFFPMGRKRESGWMTRGCFLALALAVLVARHGATGFWGGPGGTELTWGGGIARMLGAAGIYGRSLLFPFDVSPYMAPEWIPGVQDLISGVVVILVTAWMAVRWKNRPTDRLPLALFLVFFLGHLPAALSGLLIGTAPRFMTVPFLGGVWILLKAGSGHPRARNTLAVVLMIAMSLFVPLQVSAYRSNLEYWQRLHRTYPDSSHFSLQLSREYVSEGRFLEAEDLLEKIRPKESRESADRLLLLANVDLARGDYVSLWRRLGEVLAGNPDEAAESAALRLRARSLLLRGETRPAFDIMEALLKKRFRLDWLEEYHRMLLGRCLWDRARKLEDEALKRGLPFNRDARAAAARFVRMSNRERLYFFSKNWNPREALLLVEEMPASRDIGFMKAGLLYFAGETAEAENTLADLAQTPGVALSIGTWYLRRMQRPEESLRWLRRAAAEGPTSAETGALIRWLESRRVQGITGEGEP